MKRTYVLREKMNEWRSISRLMTNHEALASLPEKLLCTFAWLPMSIVWWILGFLILNVSSCLITLLLMKLGIANDDALTDELCNIMAFTLNVDRKIDLFFYGLIRKNLPDEQRELVDEMIENFGTF